MKPNRTGPRPGAWYLGVGAALIGVASVAIATGSLRNSVTYMVDDFCLSFDRSAVTYAYDNAAANRVLPIFLVPLDVPTISALDNADATGMDVRYSKWHDGPFNVNSFEGCGGTDLGNGLVDFAPRKADDNSISLECPRAPAHRRLLPTQTDPLSGQIMIWCSPDPIVQACRMADRMSNGWEAEIMLPRTHLDQWRAASAAARTYFGDFLTDCGGPNDL